MHRPQLDWEVNDFFTDRMSLNLMRRTQSRRRGGDKFLEDEARRNQAKHTELEQDLTKREVSYCHFSGSEGRLEASNNGIEKCFLYEVGDAVVFVLSTRN